MKKKEIVILRDFSAASGLKFIKGDRYEVKVLQVGFCGGFNRYLEDRTMEGDRPPKVVSDNCQK
jgi:hypothetical protein